MEKCAWPSCERPRGKTYRMCTMHYQRSVKGTPMDAPVKVPNGALMDHLKRSLLSNVDECVIWPFGRDKDGYAKASAAQEEFGTNRAYRVVCIIKHGPPPTPEHQAAHSCGRGYDGCINHNHIRWKTPTENNRDKVGHGTNRRGEECGRSKLTQEDVKNIRLMCGFMPQSEVGEAYGVTQSCISAIIRRKSWSWLD